MAHWDNEEWIDLQTHPKEENNNLGSGMLCSDREATTTQ